MIPLSIKIKLKQKNKKKALELHCFWHKSSAMLVKIRLCATQVRQKACRSCSVGCDACRRTALKMRYVFQHFLWDKIRLSELACICCLWTEWNGSFNSVHRYHLYEQNYYTQVNIVTLQ